MKSISHCAIYTTKLLYFQSNTSNSNDIKVKSNILTIDIFIWFAFTFNVKYLELFVLISLLLSIDLFLLTSNLKFLNRCIIRRYCRRVSRFVISFIVKSHNVEKLKLDNFQNCCTMLGKLETWLFVYRSRRFVLLKTLSMICFACEFAACSTRRLINDLHKSFIRQVHDLL